ncbi:hypothetical protein EDB84DRAFT_1681136 [Lactarius hengduanensis]|nr:hypothetical protein EDB84DRAFT_1681136 [Lactarius hengduanensis]
MSTTALADAPSESIPTPDDDGVYTCDICRMKVRVGNGGSKNFLQHRGSPGCLKVAKTQKSSTPSTSQTNTLHSYFTKVTQGGTSSEQSQARNGVASKAALPKVLPQRSPLLAPLPTPGLPHGHLGWSWNFSAVPDQSPDARALALLADITRAALELPPQVPLAEEHDDMARVVLAGGPEDPSEAWEHLDRVLNRLLGFDIDIEKLAQRVRRGPLGVEGLTQYVRSFVVDYGVAAGLLEGKLGRLSKAIELVKRRGPHTTASISPNLPPEVPPTEDGPETTDTPSSPSHLLRSRSRSANTNDDDDDIEYIGTLPSSDSAPRLPTLSSPSIAVPGLPVNNRQGVSKARQEAMCKRHVVSAPHGQTGIGAYPFLLHVEEHTPWEFSSYCGTLLLHARKCENRDLDENGLCQPCRALLSNLKFKKVLDRIENGVNEKAPYKFHGLAGMTETARKKIVPLICSVFGEPTTRRNLSGAKAQSPCTGSGNVPRLDRVLRVASDRRMSVAAILDLIQKAGRGLYRPKGFTEKEDLQTLLFLRLGGQRVAEIAHRMFGIPAPSTVRRRTIIPPLICSPSYPLAKDLETNLAAAFDSLSATLAAQGKYHIVLMFDEIAQETRPRWCDRTNQILGWCREHTKGRCMDFNSIADAELLFQDMVCGNVHLAHEATVGAIGILCNNSRLYSAKPFLISGSCKKETAEDHAILIQTALDAIKLSKALSNARVVSIASDGEAKRGKALVLLTFKQKLSPFSPIYPWLSACALLDLHVGDNDITCDKDWKHVGAKRPRNALLREKGLLVQGTWITPPLLRSHLLEAGHKPQHVRAVLNPNDKQDVLLAYTLLRDIWSLPRLTSGPPGRIKARDSLRLFGSMCRHFLMPYICVDLSIEDQLEHLSYAAHLALVLYVHEKACSNFVPTALYVDLIMMVKNVFFCVAKAKIDTPNDDFNIVLLGTDRLENLFGCLRTIIGNDANVDNYQLGSRLTGTMESANILALHPEWDKAPRRLHLPCVSLDSSEIPSSADHISPRSWRASQALNSVTPPTVWIRGRRKLEADHPFVCDILCAVEAIPDATMLAPFGTLLVHASLPGDDSEDSSHDDVLRNLAQDAVLSDPHIPITGNGICELEDAATSLEWAPDKHTFSNVVTVEDDTSTLNKSRALSLLFRYSKSTSSADRLRRVQQQARFVQSEPDTFLDDASEDLGDILMVNNPIASLVSCEDNIFLCVGEIIGIHLGSKAVDYLRLDVLLEDTVRITYQVYSLVSTSDDDDQHYDKYDWKTHHLLPIKFKVPGNLVQPINPPLAMPPSRAPFYLFETSTLIAFSSGLRDRLTKPQLKFIPETMRTDRFPYRERSGEACFVAEDLYDVREFSTHECPACVPPVQLDTTNGQRVLAHIASHILHDPTIDRRPGRNYPWALKYGGTASCPNATNFSYSTAMVSSSSSPSSNVPLQCPYCPDGSPAVWRYNMQIHFRQRHRGVDTMKHEDLWKLTPEEEEAMAQIWKDRRKQPKRRGKGKSKVPLKVSEAHSSRRLSSYIACEDETANKDFEERISESEDENDEHISEDEYRAKEDDNTGNRIMGAEEWEAAESFGGSEEVQPWSNGAEGSGEGAPTLLDENDVRYGADTGEGMLKGSETVDGRGESGIGAVGASVSVALVTRANEYTPATDVAAHLPTECPMETNNDSGLLRGAQMSSFGRKRKLRNMHDISECLCGDSAAPSAELPDVKQDGASGRGFPNISAQSVGLPIFVNGEEREVHGTSGATPVVAGTIALINDWPELCFLNPWLYGRTARALSDVTNGTNPGCNTDGFSAVPGWDPVMGLGTLVGLFPGSSSWSQDPPPQG